MALEHSRLRLENKSGRIFSFRQVYFTKSCQQIWGCINHILNFLYVTPEVKRYYLSYRPRTEYSISQFFTTNCKKSIFRTINRGLLAKPFKKFPKSPIRPAGSHFWQAPNFQWTLKELRFNIIKNLLCLFFLLNGFITMCNLKKRLIRAAFWVLLQAMFMNDWKQTAQRLKLQERLLTINKRNIIRWNIYRDNNFHSRRQVLKCL